MNFSIAIYSAPQCPVSRRALYFAKAVLQNGHHIKRLFFYQQGIYNAITTIVMPQDELNLHDEWKKFIEVNQLDAIVCIAAALKRGQLDKIEADRYHKAASTIGPPWQLSGLGQLHEAIQTSDRFICFGGIS